MQKRTSLITAVLLWFTSFPASAAIVQLIGDTVDFFYDDSQPGMAVYGTLSVVGDSIFASPTGFRASASNGAADSINPIGTVTVVAKSGYRFDSVLVAQQGDYQLSDAAGSVSSTASLTVSDNTSPVPLPAIVAPLFSGSDFTLADGNLHQWNSSVTTDLSMPAWQGVSSIDLTLDSLLAATAGANGSALIQAKFVGGGLVTINTTPVPLPASLWLFASGLALLGRRLKTGTAK